MGVARCSEVLEYDVNAKSKVQKCANGHVKDHPGATKGPLNYYQREDGKHVYEQYVYWETVPREREPAEEEWKRTAPAEPPEAVPEATPQYWRGKGYTAGQAAAIAEWCDKNKMSPSPWTIEDIIGKVPEPAEPSVEGPTPERTMEYWQAKGYTDPQAAHIAKWVKANDKVPSANKIREIIAELKAPEETELRKAWREYAENPDIVRAIGLLPSSTIESFSRVFTGWSYIDDKPAQPRAGDWTAVGSIITGAVLAAFPIVVYLIPTAGIGGTLTTSTAPATAAALTKGGAISAGWSGLTKVMLGLLLVSQLDVVCWGFGFCPSRIHDKIDRSIRNLRSSLITLSTMVKNEDWDGAREISDSMKAQFNEVKSEMASMPSKFFEDAGFSMDDLEVSLNTLEDEFNAYINSYPQLSRLPAKFPKEFKLEDVKVVDGDTIEYPGHPEAGNTIRIIGIDTHESETDAGKEETEYLRTLIEGRTVTIKTHQYGTPDMTLDVYGRLLGGVFLGGKDIALDMLGHFGKTILTPTKYQDKYRWIDWDEYKRTADGATGPAVQEFKILIDSEPSNAKLYIDGAYTHHLTPSDQDELKDVMHMLTPGEHTFKATKAGLEGAVKWTVTDGGNPNIIINLSTKGLEEVEAEEPEPEPPEEAPEEPEEFKINILSTPSRAKLYIDGIYTHHLTPTDESELRRGPHYGIELFTAGEHTIEVRKGGKAATKKVTFNKGYNEPIYLTLEVVGLPRTKDEIEKEITAARALLEKLETELQALG
jgi:hypothetical protein